MTRQGNTLVVLIIGCVLIFALAMPSLLTAGSSFLQGLQDFVNEGLGEIGGFTDSNSSSSSSIGLLVHYNDGTEKYFEPSLSSMSIIDPEPQKIVTWVKPQAHVTLRKTGSLSSWSCTGKLKIRLKEEVGGALIYEWAETQWSKSGSSWTSGQAKLMADKTIQAIELDNILEGAGVYQDNDKFELNIYAEITELTVNFEDGTTETWTMADIGGTRTYWVFLWVHSEITSVSISVSFEKG